MKKWNKIIKKFIDKYIGQKESVLKIPEFEISEERRYRIIFSGVVQGVGFRYEVWRIAEKVGVTGFAKNLPDGNVLVEIQGEKNRLLYIVEYMKNIPRIYVEKVILDEIELVEEKEFLPIYM